MQVFFLLVALGVPAPWLAAQEDKIVARQIEVEKEAIQEFDSPMLLEVPVPGLSKMSVNGTKSFGLGLKKFVCEDASLRSLIVRRRRDRKVSGERMANFEIEGTIHVRESYDRLVNLRFNLVEGGTTLRAAALNSIDAEEKKHTGFKLTLAVPLEKLEAAFENDPPPILEIKVVVRDNS